MRTNKWSAAVGLITLLLSGGSTAETTKPCSTNVLGSAPDQCEQSCCGLGNTINGPKHLPTAPKT